MGRKLRPNDDTVALLTELLDAAKRGELQDIFAVYRRGDGQYDSCFNTNDLDDLLYEVGGEVIRARSAAQRADAAARRQ